MDRSCGKHLLQGVWGREGRSPLASYRKAQRQSAERAERNPLASYGKRAAIR